MANACPAVNNCTDDGSGQPDSEDFLLQNVTTKVTNTGILHHPDDAKPGHDRQLIQDAILRSPQKMLKEGDSDRTISVNFVSAALANPGPEPALMQLEDEFMIDDEFIDIPQSRDKDEKPSESLTNGMDIDEVDFKILEVCSEESKDSSSNEDSSAFSSLRSSPVPMNTGKVDKNDQKDNQRRHCRVRAAKVKRDRKSSLEDSIKTTKSKTKSKSEQKNSPITESAGSVSNDVCTSTTPFSPSIAGGTYLPDLTSAGGEGRLKSRRGSKVVSDSEDSSVSTDTPLKPGSYLRRYGGVAHGDKSGRSTGADAAPVAAAGRSTPSKSSSDKFRIDKLTETGSPREEQPLIPKNYIQKKKLESEKELADSLKMPAEVETGKLSPEELRIKADEERKEIEKRLKSFRHITENHYLCQRKINKQFRRWQCDCDAVKDENGEIERGCLEDCTNRMMMIECGKDCPLENYCANKRIQNKENAPIEVFKTHWKGFGIRATEDIPQDTFIMEYVGEALDHKQFRRRAKQYARTNIQHFYFMALSTDCYVDATNKGNISRFINHSCDPNSMTQKWMVNGENRVGFFTTRDVKRGEELNFDYKYERYGQAAQKCYCGTAKCNGWLGKEPTSDSGIDEMEEWTTSEEEDEGEEAREVSMKEDRARQEKKVKKEQRRQRDEERRRWREEEEWEEEVDRLSKSGINNRIQTVLLCRLMLRASQVSSRQRLAQLLLDADRPCLRLFLDYHGLRVLSTWMQDLEWSSEDLDFKLKCEKLLAALPIPHKTMLKDSKVWSTTQLWALATPANPNPPIPNRSPKPVAVIEPRRKTESIETNSKPRAEASLAQNPPEASEPYHVDTSQPPPRQPFRPITSQPLGYEKDLCPPGEDLYPPGEEPASEPSKEPTEPNGSPIQPSPSALDRTEDEIQVLEEFDAESSSRSNSRTESRSSSRNEGRMKLKVVGVEEVILEEEGRGQDVSRALYGQGGVGTEGDLDILVLPNRREEIPLTEEEELERILLIGKIKTVQKKAADLLESWAPLQEYFKIPKKERHKLRVEHEREADRHFRHCQSSRKPPGSAIPRTYDTKAYESARGSGFTPDRGGANFMPDRGNSAFSTPDRGVGGGGSINTPDRDRQDSRGPGGGGSRSTISRYDKNIYDKKWQSTYVVPPERRNLRLDDASGRLHVPGLSRDERRTLFEDKIKEESRMKAVQAALGARHNQCCRLLGLDPKATPLFDNYPTHYLVGGERWQPMPEPPLPVDLGADWTVPNMAALPTHAYSATDPKFPNPRDIYPPGVCPQEPPPKPRIIRVPGFAATEFEVTAYFEEIHRRKPKSPPSSPRPDEAPATKPAKKEVPPYPGYVVYNAPEVIFFDPESLKPKPPPPLPNPGTPLQGATSHQSTPTADESSRNASREGSSVRKPPSSIEPTRSSKRSDAFKDSASHALSNNLAFIKDAHSASSSRSSSRLSSTNQEVSGGLGRGERVPAARRSLDSDLGADSLLLEQIREELKQDPVELSPDYKSPSPVRKRCDSPSESPVAPVPAPRLPPRSLDLLNSNPEHEISLQTSKPRLDPIAPDGCDIQQDCEDYGTPLASRQAPEDRQPAEPSLTINHQPLSLETCQNASHSTRVNGTMQLNLQTGSTQQLSAANYSTQLVVRLPRNWKVARDGSGRVYYYHVESRAVQWEPPTINQIQEDAGGNHRNLEDYNSEEVAMEIDSSEEDEDEEEEDEEEEDGGEKDGDEAVEPIEEGELTQDQDLSASEKKMLLRIRNRTVSSREERSVRRKAKRRLERERREQEREINEARSKRHRESGLVSEQLVPRDRNNSAAKEIRERLLHKEEVLTRIDKEIRDDEMADRLEQERIRREQKKAEKLRRDAESSAADRPARRSNGEISTREILTPEPKVPPAATAVVARHHSTPSSRPAITAAAADTSTSAEVEKKAKDRFAKQMSAVIVKTLDPFRAKGCKGHIKSSEDFKHLAKKLTYVIYEKERAQVRAAEDLKITEKMKEKAADYVRKKMNNYGKEYRRSPQK